MTTKKKPPPLDRTVPAARLGAGELDNIVYLCLRYTCDWSMREADKQVILRLARTTPPSGVVAQLHGPEGVRRVIREACVYAWDHLMGEPKDVTPAKLIAHMTPIISHWFSATTRADREKTE